MKRWRHVDFNSVPCKLKSVSVADKIAKNVDRVTLFRAES